MNMMRALVFIGSMASIAGADDWPQFLGPNRDNTSAETGLLRAWPEGGPRLLWSIEAGPGHASPAIVGDEAYFLDRVDDARDILRCVSMTDGAERWRYEYDAPGGASRPGSRNPPAVDDKYVFSIGIMGDLLCVDRATHQVVWRKQLVKDFGGELPGWGVSQTAVLHKDLVIVNAQAPDAFTVAFKRDTGELAWKSPGLGLPGYVSPVLLTLAGVEQVVVVAASNRLGTKKGGTAGLSLEDGSVLWKYEGWQCFIPIANPTPLGGDRLFITAGYGAGSAIVRIGKGAEGLNAIELKRLDAKECGSHIQQPIVHRDHLYVNSNSNERNDGLTCLTLDGALKWRTGGIDGAPGFDRGCLLLADGMLVMLEGKRGTLHLIDPGPEGYKELAQAKVLEGNEMWAPLALSNGRLIVRNQESMKCLDLKTP